MHRVIGDWPGDEIGNADEQSKLFRLNSVCVFVVLEDATGPANCKAEDVDRRECFVSGDVADSNGQIIFDHDFKPPVSLISQFFHGVCSHNARGVI